MPNLASSYHRGMLNPFSDSQSAAKGPAATVASTLSIHCLITSMKWLQLICGGARQNHAANGNALFTIQQRPFEIGTILEWDKALLALDGRQKTHFHGLNVDKRR